MGVQKIVQDWPQHILSADWRSGDRKYPFWRRLLATSESFRLLELRQHTATCDCVALAGLTEPHRAGGPVEKLRPDTRFEERDRPADRCRRSLKSTGGGSEAPFVKRRDEDAHCLNTIHRNGLRRP